MTGTIFKEDRLLHNIKQKKPQIFIDILIYFIKSLHLMTTMITGIV